MSDPFAAERAELDRENWEAAVARNDEGGENDE